MSGAIGNLICISGNGTGPGDAREDWKQKKKEKEDYVGKFDFVGSVYCGCL